MTNEDINNALYRELKNGAAYERFFKPSQKSTTHLATGNTSQAIKQMAVWANKYAYQATAIAKELEAENLSETIYNIHQFLYWHIQYNIDGYNQNLKAPYACWETRKEGTDCKSYTVFASTVLLNLGLKHYLRRIKQQGALEDVYTHVYAVVPLDQQTGSLKDGYYIIDGTIKDNMELPFTKNNDLFMKEPYLPINGLAGALACGACGGNNTTTPPVFAMAYPMPKSYDLYQGYGRMGAVVTTAAVVGTLAKLKDTEIYDNTVGAVFANGFDLSCWNSSSSPAEAQSWFDKYLYPFYLERVKGIEQATSTAQLSNLISELDKTLRAVEAHQLFHKDQSKASCSKEGNQIKADFAKNLALQLYTTAIALKKDGYDVTYNEQDFTASSVKVEGVSINWKGRTVDAKYRRYTITKSNVVSDIVNTVTDTVTGGTTTTLDGANTVQQAGMGTTQMLLLGGVVVGGIVMGMKKFGK